MPPKAKPSAARAASSALIKTGPKEVQVHASRHGKRGERGEKPTTTRALVLRNGKQGAMGTGEIISTTKMTGREKLDLLAEDLTKKMQQAVLTPFRLDKLLSIAESQFGLYRDDIVNLKDPELFRDLIDSDLVARTRPGTEPRRNATNLAKIIGTRVHNSYMLTSAWKLVRDALTGLQRDGLSDKNVKTKLKADEGIRTRYLVLFDMVNNLVDMSHHKLSVLATTAPHYAPFFKPKPAEFSAPGETEMVFEWGNKNLRSVTESFLDSIVIELCFPQAPFPRSVLYILLRDCVDESPHEAKRFSQSMWNAMGDLSVCVELQTILEGPLLGPEGEAWRKEPRAMPEEFEKWVDAQFFSQKASNEVTNWKDFCFPLVATRKKDVMNNIWKTMNANYQAISGCDIDTLWQLNGALEITPQWSAYYVQKLPELSDEEDEDGLPALKPVKKKKKPLAIMGADGNDSTTSMPDLQSVSNSSDDQDYSEESSDDEDDSEYESDESGYNTEEEDEIRDLLREAMDAGHEVDWFDSNAPTPAIDPLRSDERKGNPFLQVLGSLRGRLFNSNPKIKVPTARTEPRPGARNAFRFTSSGAPKAVPKTAPPKPTPASAQTATQPEGPKKTTMEEVEDEDAAPQPGKKKKKKKPKKKKPAGSADGQDLEVPDSPTASARVPRSPTSPTSAAFGPSASTLNIPIETTQAQSIHSYLKQQDIDGQKAKVKSRPDHASIFSQDSKKSSGAGLFSKLTKPFKKDEGKNPKYTWFSRLSKKTTETMHTILRTSEDADKQTAPMKWETFLKLMREMGFEYDPGTAGSSVRFTPPDSRDKPISIHKPHPDKHITPINLRRIGKRLKRYYGWNEEDFMTAAAAA
ncbi:hypothetical protein FA15DRAFT_620109 [Coprinopsis marcescibilis]|uniref:Uncharacterized protein n=1 Tax=Coprinopsis marcescibilis TaxID=230819 RepID=A0A5C3KUG6_COPMA|nr:hypothetical protein FA15DRAFT_620109 [Coprinopsis marcescibilis]